ncbi:MAG: S8/S53 family peptidase, partial [Alphaproteobacteria bacterium]
MPAARSRQSVLVKVRRGPISGRIAFGAGPAIRVTLTPLFESIRPTRRRGAAAPAEWHVLAADRDEAEAAPWDLCHALLDGGLGLAGAPPVEAAEPDVEQQWTWGDTRRGPGFAAAGCDAADPPSAGLPTGSVRYWFRDGDHSQLEPARDHVGDPAGERVRIAHLDTGYDRNHVTIPRHLRADLQRSFVDGDDLFDATDDSAGFFNQLGHGTGTIGILAGDAFEQGPLGGAPYMEVVPIRVANSVVLFKNSAIARAFDYVHELHATASRRVDVVTLSMGGLASNAWAEAVNALYEAGVFIVAAAGNNYGNLPTREIVFPARFYRVVAACGVMADGRPYADLGLTTMAGNYGPASKMATALAAFTPNAPWPRFGCRDIVDLNGAGTSSATPQVAAAAALWIQKHRAAWQAYPQGWMRVEAVRKALFESARTGAGVDPVRLGRGTLRARAALDRAPAPASSLTRAPEDRGSFPIL